MLDDVIIFLLLLLLFPSLPPPTHTKRYALYVCAFAAGIYSNMRALSVSNVETIIVFRACTPMCVASIEYLFMNREFPSAKSTGSLVVVMMGAAAYVYGRKQRIFVQLSRGHTLMAWYTAFPAKGGTKHPIRVFPRGRTLLYWIYFILC